MRPKSGNPGSTSMLPLSDTEVVAGRVNDVERVICRSKGRPEPDPRTRTGPRRADVGINW
jgi:hypothetical protein